MDSFALGGFSQGLNEGLKSVQQGVMQAEQLKQAQVQRESQEEQLKTLKMQNEQLQKDMAKQQTFEALDLFANSGDTTKVNYLLKNNPSVSQAFGGNIARVDAINDYDMEHFSLDPSKMQVGRYAKITKKDGTQTLVDMDQIYAATGYLNYASNKQKELLQNRATIAQAKQQEEASKVIQQGIEYLYNKSNEGSVTPIDAAKQVATLDKIPTNHTPYQLIMAQTLAGLQDAKRNGTITPEQETLLNSIIALGGGTNAMNILSENVNRSTIQNSPDYKPFDANFDKGEFVKQHPELERDITTYERNLENSVSGKHMLNEYAKVNKDHAVSDMAEQSQRIVDLLKENPNLDTNIVNNFLNNIKGYIGFNIRDIPTDEKQRFEFFSALNNFLSVNKKLAAGATLSANEKEMLEASIINLKKNKFVNITNMVTQLDQNIAALEGVSNYNKELFALKGFNKKVQGMQVLRDALNKTINPDAKNRYNNQAKQNNQTVNQQVVDQTPQSSTKNTVDPKNMTAAQKLKAMDSIAGGGL